MTESRIESLAIELLALVKHLKKGERFFLKSYKLETVYHLQKGLLYDAYSGKYQRLTTALFLVLSNSLLSGYDIDVETLEKEGYMITNFYIKRIS